MTRYPLVWADHRATAEHRVGGDLVIDVGSGVHEHTVRLTVRGGDVPRLLAALDADRHEDAAAVLSIHVAQVARPTLVEWLEAVGVRHQVRVVPRPPRAG